MKRWAFLVAASILGTGCVMEPIEAPAWQIADPVDPHAAATTLSLRADSGALVVTVGDAEITGGEVSLGRFVDRDEADPQRKAAAIRGRAFGRVVNAEAADGHVVGLFGGRPIDLSIARHGGALHVEGRSRGERAELVVGPRRVSGKVGRCSYDLTRGETAYEGRRSCGGPSERVALHVPSMLACWSDEERGAALAILLGG